MLPVPLIIWHEWRARGNQPRRQPEPHEAMDDAEQVRAYVKAYEWNGPTSALQLHHLRELSRLIRPGDTVADLACGPGPLLLELAPLFPEVSFIGADLSPTMLRHLREEARVRGLKNVTVLEEDIRTLPSLGNGTVDLVMSTSALHHLPEEAGLVDVFRRCRSLLKPDGGFYFFDFGLLRSSAARALFVAEVARLAPPVTARDYAESLDAAFRIDWVRDVARQELPRPFQIARSAFVDICYFLQSPPRVASSPLVEAYVSRRWQQLPVAMKLEHLMLRWLRRSEAA
jgi:SAM-dependent methyltransferase